VKIRESDLDGNGAPGGVLAGQPARQVSQDFCECRVRLCIIFDIALVGAFFTERFAIVRRLDLIVIDTIGNRQQPLSPFAEFSDQLFCLGRLQIADSAQAQTD